VPLPLLSQGRPSAVLPEKARSVPCSSVTYLASRWRAQHARRRQAAASGRHQHVCGVNPLAWGQAEDADET
jgi:hypothetical protein